MLIQAQEYLTRDKTRDGLDLVIRSIRPDDKPILQEGMHHMSEKSLYSRFFTFKKELTDKELAYFTEMDFIHHVGLLASVIHNAAERPVGVGRYICDEAKKPQSAELAFAVDEEFQGKGIATVLLKHLIRIARDNGMKEFRAFVLPGNEKMLAVLNNCALAITSRLNEAFVEEITIKL